MKAIVLAVLLCGCESAAESQAGVDERSEVCVMQRRLDYMAGWDDSRRAVGVYRPPRYDGGVGVCR